MDPVTAVEQADYGTWVRVKRLYFFAALTALTGAGSLLALVSAWFALLLAPTVLFGYVVAVLALTIWRLGARGGDYRRRIHELIVEKSSSDPASRGLDVGCGSGSLAILLAKASPDGSVVGIDFWGEDWEYSKEQCERNARIEGVARRTTFLGQSAASLQFEDASFDTVVSCLTFHEIRDLTDKTLAVGEALRVLRPGGRYAFLDLFADPGSFRSFEHVRRAITQAGAEIEEATRLSAHLRLPFPLNGPQVLGRAVLIAGTKRR